MLNIFAEELQHHCASVRLEFVPCAFTVSSSANIVLRVILSLQLPTPGEVFAAVEALMRRCRGGYAVAVCDAAQFPSLRLQPAQSHPLASRTISVVIQLLIHGVGVLCFRDPWGIRPLCYGTRKSPHGVDFACASESVALDSLRFDMEGDVQSGEAILATFDGAIHKRMCHESAIRAPCIFEYVYFARPDTLLDGVSVYEARLRMGEHLAEKILRLRPDHDIDVVIPIPDTSRTSALECARVLQRPFREGFIKNRYIARTFIMPGQETRKKSVRLKLNTIKAEFRRKNVLLVDDSIVRGTTSRELVLMAREVSPAFTHAFAFQIPEAAAHAALLTCCWQAGANKVYFVSAAPAVRYPNVYGIDIPTRSELVAYGREDDEVADAIGADWVVYQDLDALEDSVRHFNSELKTFDASCFNGVYITGDIDEAYFCTAARSQERATEERVPT